jgi:O-antigen/teichoic acid export membrane protein
MVWRRLIGHLPVNVAGAIAGFGAIALFTRILPDADYGRYALVLSTMMLAHTLLLTWAEAAAFRFLPVARGEGKLAHHFATLLAIAAIAGVGAAALTACVLLAAGLEPAINMSAAFAAAATATRFISKIARETDRAEHEVAHYSAFETFYLLGGFAFGAGAILLLDLGPAGPFAGMALAGLICASLDLPRLMRRARGGDPEFVRARTYALFGAPLAAALALELLVQTIARFIVADQLGEAAVGAYAAAYGLAGRSLDLIFIWAGMAAAPLALSAFEEQGRAAALKVAERTMTMLTALAIPAAVGLALVAQPLAEQMVGESLRAPVVALIPWLALSGLAAGFTTYYFSEAFQLTRRTGLRAVLMAAPAVLCLALTWAWTGAYGLTGAAAAQAVSSVFGACLLALVGRRLLPLPLALGQWSRVGLATAIMALAVAFVPAQGGFIELAAKALVGVLVYATAAFFLNIAGFRDHASTLFQRLSGKLHVQQT